MLKNIAILGSTGSIGTQALEVIRQHPQQFRVSVLTARHNAGLLIRQALEFRPDAVVIGCKSSYDKVRKALTGKGIDVFAGKNELDDIAAYPGVDLVLVALVGYSGLKPVINAIDAGKDVALANKESLVVAGRLITSLAKEKNVNILPVDSEHSAIFQCLAGEEENEIEKIYLTASGGPFYGKDRNFLEKVSVEQALDHPNWNMGKKITIDSASLMNKGLEVIEASRLFNLNADQIEVVVHPQSVIHSVVQFIDGSMKAQMGLPDMKVPIQYAFTYPSRFRSDFPRFSFADYSQLTFFQADSAIFRNLALAFEALRREGNVPCILNAANEVAVDAFLHEKIGFMQMPEIIEQCMEQVGFIADPSYDDFVDTNLQTKQFASEILKNFRD